MWAVQARGVDGEPMVWRDGARSVQAMPDEETTRLFAASNSYPLPGVYASLDAARMAFEVDRECLARLSETLSRPLTVSDLRERC